MTRPVTAGAGAAAAGAHAPRGADDALLRGLAEPESLLGLSAGTWDVLLRRAREAQLAGRLQALLAERGALGALPPRVSGQLEAARALVEQQHRLIRWELGRLRRTLGPLRVPLVLLKGAAYLEAGLPPARGRLFSDVDLLVPEPDLPAVEETLLKAGWQFVKVDPYDQRYYRLWSHELPPLCHRDREVVVDVHHNILPPTGRLRPDPARLLAAARPVPGSGFRVLAPADMVLHTTAHLLQSGETHAALRDLVDLDALLRHLGPRPGFWGDLVRRAGDLGLTRVALYGLRHAVALLGTPVPPVAIAALAPAAPPRPVLAVMEALFRRAVVPPHPDRSSSGPRAARALLLLRYHWLRMPPGLLVRHLLHKALRPRPRAA